MKYFLIILSILGGIYYGSTIRNKLPSSVYAVQIKNETKEMEVAKIEKILKNTPAYKYSQDFWEAHERYRIDYRILLSIAFLESTFFNFDSCRFSGKANGFGYQSNGYCFSDYKTAIHSVAKTLATSHYYQRQNSFMKIFCMWNIGVAKECDYGRKAIELMEKYES